MNLQLHIFLILCFFQFSFGRMPVRIYAGNQKPSFGDIGLSPVLGSMFCSSCCFYPAGPPECQREECIAKHCVSPPECYTSYECGYRRTINVPFRYRSYKNPSSSKIPWFRPFPLHHLQFPFQFTRF